MRHRLRGFDGLPGLLDFTTTEIVLGLAVDHLLVVDALLVGLLGDELRFHVVEKGIDIGVRSVGGEHGLDLRENASKSDDLGLGLELLIEAADAGAKHGR